MSADFHLADPLINLPAHLGYFILFALWNALGGIAWATSVGLLSYYLGPAAEHLFKVAGISGIVAAALIIGGFLAWRRFGRASDTATP